MPNNINKTSHWLRWKHAQTNYLLLVLHLQFILDLIFRGTKLTPTTHWFQIMLWVPGTSKNEASLSTNSAKLIIHIGNKGLSWQNLQIIRKHWISESPDGCGEVPYPTSPIHFFTFSDNRLPGVGCSAQQQPSAKALCVTWKYIQCLKLACY